MSTTEITVHGKRFAIEAAGLTTHESDRDIGVAAIETHLRALPAAVVERLHADDRASWDAHDEQSDALHAIGLIGRDAATVGWARRDAVYFTVSAA